MAQTASPRQAYATRRPGGSAARGKRRGLGQGTGEWGVWPGMVGGIMAGLTGRTP
jgi:hypothetical protein